MSFNSIQYSTSTHPSERFDLSHDVITTFNFGEVQPTSVRLCPTPGKHKITTTALVRLAGLQRPTFGRMHYRQYHQFVPIEDIFWQFPHFLANIKALQDPTGSSLTQVTRIPHISLCALTEQLLKLGNCDITCYERSTSDATLEWTPCITGGNKAKNSIIPHHTNWATLTDVTKRVGTGDRWETSITDHTSPHFVTPDNADFQACTDLGGSGDTYRMCIRLTNKGMRLYKILLGCGYKATFGRDNDMYVSLLPLMAFYKAYWDIFHLTQYDNFEATPLYRLIKYLDTYGTTTPLDYFDTPVGYTQDVQAILDDMFDDLSECFYTANQDFVSAHEPVVSNTLRQEKNQTFQNFKYTHHISAVSNPDQAIYQTYDGTPQVNSSSYNLAQLDLELLKKMYYWANKASKIGYALADVLTAKGLGQFVAENKERSCYIGSSHTPISVSELLSTAETAGMSGQEGAHIGDYAGQSSQLDNNKPFHYTNDRSGYIVSLACVTVEPRQSMALDPTLLGISADGQGSIDYANEFYNPMFDGFGLEYTPLACIGHDNYLVDCDNGHKESSTFGQIAKYSGWKIGQNIRNGMFASLANLDTFAPFHLDKLILKDGYLRANTPTTSGKFKDLYTPANEDILPLAGRIWRVPNRYDNIGNYNRIFYNDLVDGHLSTTDFDRLPASDNFMVFMVYDHQATQNMLPISRSWDTMDEEGQENTADGTSSANQ